MMLKCNAYLEQKVTQQLYRTLPDTPVIIENTFFHSRKKQRQRSKFIEQKKSRE